MVDQYVWRLNRCPGRMLPTPRPQFGSVREADVSVGALEDVLLLLKKTLEMKECNTHCEWAGASKKSVSSSGLAVPVA